MKTNLRPIAKLPNNRNDVYAQLSVYHSEVAARHERLARELRAAVEAERDEYAEPVPYDDDDEVTIQRTLDFQKEAEAALVAAQVHVKVLLSAAQSISDTLQAEYNRRRKINSHFQARWQD